MDIFSCNITSMFLIRRSSSAGTFSNLVIPPNLLSEDCTLYPLLDLLFCASSSPALSVPCWFPSEPGPERTSVSLVVIASVHAKLSSANANSATNRIIAGVFISFTLVQTKRSSFSNSCAASPEEAGFWPVTSLPSTWT